MSKHSAYRQQTVSSKHTNPKEKSTVSQTPNPPSLISQSILQLQKSIGNQAVQRFLKQHSPSTAQVQQHSKDKTQIGKPEKDQELARLRHEENKNILRGTVTNMSNSDDEITKNTAEWFTSGKIKLYALTKTHDAEQRAKSMNNEKDIPYFGYPVGSVFPSEPSLNPPYSTDPKSNNDIFWLERYASGNNIQGESVLIVEPKDRKSDLQQVLRHEIQHSADRHHQLRDNKNVTDFTNALEVYKTEYRAYSVQGKGEELNFSKSDAKKSFSILNGGVKGASTYNWTKGQYEIFEYIYNGYDVVKNMWKQEMGKDKGDRKFQKEVVNFRDHDASPNPQNSLTLDRFYDYLEKVVKWTEFETKNFYDIVIKKGMSLSKSDLAAVLKSEIWQNYESKMNQNVYNTITKEWEKIVNQPQEENQHMLQFFKSLQKWNTPILSTDQEYMALVLELVNAGAGVVKMVCNSDGWRLIKEKYEAEQKIGPLQTQLKKLEDERDKLENQLSELRKEQKIKGQVESDSKNVMNVLEKEFDSKIDEVDAQRDRFVPVKRYINKLDEAFVPTLEKAAIEYLEKLKDL